MAPLYGYDRMVATRAEPWLQGALRNNLPFGWHEFRLPFQEIESSSSTVLFIEGLCR
jgi:hypothetical protein